MIIFLQAYYCIAEDGINQNETYVSPLRKERSEEPLQADDFQVSPRRFIAP